MMKISGKNFTCDECPACIGFDYRLKVAEEGGYEPQIEYCGCDKVQSEFYMGGFCEDAFVDEVKCRKANPRKTGSAYRRMMKKQKKDRLMEIITRGRHNSAAGYVDCDFVDGEWKPVGKYIKYPRNSNKQRFFKRYSSKRVRRRDLPFKGNGYRRYCDYWWALYWD